METETNERGQKSHIIEGRHLKLKELKVIARGLRNQYLSKYIPACPRPEFCVSRLKHDTNRAGLWGIRRKEGLRSPNKDHPLLWFSLDVGPEEIKAAEKRLLETIYPDRTEEQIQSQQSFLEKLASSPAFLRSSRLGSYRFTFSVEELLEAYRDQFCWGAEPIIRVLRTVLYKQEVMYVVLVHSPANQELYSYHPLLTDVQDYICTYKDGCFLWRSEAMCETHRYELIQIPEEKRLEVLKFDVNQLREKLTFCEKGEVNVKRRRFDDVTKAEKFVGKLWPDSPSHLKRA